MDTTRQAGPPGASRGLQGFQGKQQSKKGEIHKKKAELLQANKKTRPSPLFCGVIEYLRFKQAHPKIRSPNVGNGVENQIVASRIKKTFFFNFELSH